MRARPSECERQVTLTESKTWGRGTRINRRAFLRGAGAAIALPLLDSMLPAGTALAASAAKPQTRYAFVHLPHGAIMSQWTPKTVGRNFDITPILEGLRCYERRDEAIRMQDDALGHTHVVWKGRRIGLAHVTLPGDTEALPTRTRARGSGATLRAGGSSEYALGEGHQAARFLALAALHYVLIAVGTELLTRAFGLAPLFAYAAGPGEVRIAFDRERLYMGSICFDSEPGRMRGIQRRRDEFLATLSHELRNPLAAIAQANALLSEDATTPSQRQLVIVDRSGLHKGEPVKQLTEGKSNSGGRNNNGRITVRFLGGGHKQAYRKVDFKRRKFDVPATIERLEYDPNRTAAVVQGGSANLSIGSIADPGRCSFSTQIPPAAPQPRFDVALVGRTLSIALEDCPMGASTNRAVFQVVFLR